MKRALAVVFVAVLSAAAWAQEKTATVASTFDGALSRVEKQVLGVAEAMPEAKYGFKPTQGTFDSVREFSFEVKHVATGTYMYAATILGEKPPVNLGGPNGPENVKTKAEILQYLKDSFAYAHKALNSLDEKTMLASIPPPFGKDPTTRLEIAVRMVSHPYDHYGQMVEYLRMNGVVPPGSKP